MSLITKTALKRKISECEEQIRKIERRMESFRTTLREFYPPDTNKRLQSRRENKLGARGRHPKRIKDLLHEFPNGLTPSEIVERLEAEDYHISLPTLASVFARDRGLHIIKGEKVGKAFRYRLKEFEAQLNGTTAVHEREEAVPHAK